VEDHVVDGHLARLAPDLRLRVQAHPLLKLLEAGAPLGVQRHQFAVQHDLVRPQRLGKRPHLRVAPGHILQVPALDLDGPALAVDHCPDAVPLELESVVLLVVRLPLGISPAKSMYSSGWSSTCTARWLRWGSGGMPLGTAQLTSTPSRSSLKSQCRRVAWCSWTTKRGPLVGARLGAALGPPLGSL